MYDRALTVVVALFVAVPLHAQVLQTGFERDVNRYRCTANASASAKTGKWDFVLENRFVSDAYVLIDDRLRFRDENLLRIQALRPMNRFLSARIRGRMDWFGISRASTQRLYAGLRIAPYSNVFIEPLAGVSADRRPGALSLEQRPDVGPLFGATLGGQSSPERGYNVSVSGRALWEQTSPRRAHDVQLGAAAQRQFGATNIRTEVRTASLRRDTYQSVSFLNREISSGESIEATVSDTLDVSLDISSPIVGGVNLLFQSAFRANRRRIRTYRAPEQTLFFDTDFGRDAVEATIGAVYESQNISAQLAAEVSVASESRQLANENQLPPAEATQKANLLLQADYDEGIFGLRGSLRTILWPSITLALGGSSRIVRHDTHEANPDDRDELYHQGQIGLQWRVSPWVTADVRLFGSWYHTVYLKSVRSAENKIQRSLRLNPGIRWQPAEQTRIRLGAEVRATYTVDDFALPGRRPNDQSAREMRVEAEMEQRLWQNTDLRASGSYADLRLGRLLWNSFAEIPFDTLRTYNGWIHLETGRRLRADIGWRLYLRTDHDRSSSVRYAAVGPDGMTLYDEAGAVIMRSISRPGRRYIRQMGPTAAVTWQRGASSLRLDAWANIQRVYYRLYGGLPEISAERIRAAARKGTRRLIPMITLTVIWNLGGSQ